MSYLSTIFSFVFAVLLLISIHEWGHFIVARLFGIKVLRYSIGFGKPLWRRLGKKGTEYVIALLPLGGYVKLLDETEGEVAEADKPYAFNRKPVWVRFLVVAAGPSINLVLAVFLFWIMYMIGIQQTQPVIGKVIPQSVAAQAGLQKNDQIIAVGDKSTKTWQAVMMNLVVHLGDSGDLPITVQGHNGQQRHLSINLTNWKVDDLNPDPMKSLGLTPYLPEIPAIIAGIEPEGPAAEADLKAGDRIISVDGQIIHDWFDFVEFIQAHADQTVTIALQRAGKQMIVQVPVSSKHEGIITSYGYLGVRPPTVKLPEDMLVNLQYSPLNAVVPAFNEVGDFLMFNGIMLKKLIMGEMSLRSLGGPITIFRTSDRAWQEGIAIYISFIGLVSVMLAFANFLPIPGLDGGHLLFYVIEVLMGRPLPPAFQQLFLRLGLVILVVLMAQATLNDLLRLV